MWSKTVFFSAVFSVVSLLCSPALALEIAANSKAEQEDPYTEQRKLYLTARTAINRGSYKRYRELVSSLKQYPLLPYLEYNYILRRISRLPKDEVNAFLTNYAGLHLAKRLRHHWLRTLAKKGRWQYFLSEYQPHIVSTELKCYQLWALHQTGETESALQKIEKIWMVGKSQPDACDPVFKLARDKGILTEEHSWDRFTHALKSGNTTLARYLLRFMSGEKRKLAESYRSLYLNPQRLANSTTFRSLASPRSDMFLHILKRLSARHPQEAAEVWQKFSGKFDFQPSQTTEIERALILGFAKKDNASEYHNHLSTYAYPNDPELITAGASMSIRLEAWVDLRRLIEILPSAMNRTARWRYWYARTLQQTSDHVDSQTSHNIYRELAKQRDYYGFLAADIIHLPYQMNEERYALEGNFLEKFIRLPETIRIRELVRVAQQIDARREWRDVGASFEPDQHYTAAHYAKQMGWNTLALQSAIRAERWNDLQLRFPLLYTDFIDTYASGRSLSPTWVTAVARQESALIADARSPKGARGLMQLMPATAKEVAKKYNVRYSSSQELYQPEKNILLGSAYLRDMMDRFDGNAVYATAAYNAGPHRVSQWLKDSAGQPIDIWIENIPFAETRQYVKNVLAYSAIFSYRLGKSNFKMATSDYMPTNTLVKNLSNDISVEGENVGATENL